MKAKDWLLENGYPEFMNMTRDNLEIILNRFAALKVETERERMKKDKNHLQWLYARLVSKHGENEHYDYMIKFKEIIDSL